MKAETKSEAAESASDDRITSAPSRITAIHPAFRNTGVPLEQQIERLRQHATLEHVPVRRGHRRRPGDEARRRIRVQLFHRPVPKSFSKDGGCGRNAAVVRLSLSTGEDAHLLETKCLEVLAKLRTDCLLTLYAMLSMAMENNGYAADDLPRLARRRGWKVSSLDTRSRPGTQTRRERLREHLQMLTDIEFVLVDSSKEEARYVAFPMLRPYIHEGGIVDGRHVQECGVYEFHPLLWREMTQAGKAFFYDHAILTANSKRDEWSVRLLWYMSARWGPGWVSKELDKNGGRLTERLGVLLNGADIEYRQQLRAQGRPWLRRCFRQAMDKLLKWRPTPLIGGYVIEQHPHGPLEDRVTFWPTAAVAARYNQVRSKAIASRDDRVLRRSRQKRPGRKQAAAG